MKTFDMKDIYSWSNAEDAKQYIGKYCYFADKLDTLKEKVNKNKMSMLQDVLNPGENYVQNIFCNTTDSCWGLCLPADKVIEVKEKKYRPFKNIDEFFTTLELELGQSIVLRDKFTQKEKRTVVLTGYIENGNKLTFIQFGILEYSPAIFYNSYEVYNDNTKTWQPFGVEE
jgi:hypothetical protein